MTYGKDIQSRDKIAAQSRCYQQALALRKKIINFHDVFQKYSWLTEELQISNLLAKSRNSESPVLFNFRIPGSEFRFYG